MNLNIHIYTHMVSVLFGHPQLKTWITRSTCRDRRLWQETLSGRGHGGGSTSQAACWWTVCAVISPNGELRFHVQALQAKQRGGRRALLSSQRRVVLPIAVCCHNFAVFTDENPGDGGQHLSLQYLDLFDRTPPALFGRQYSGVDVKKIKFKLPSFQCAPVHSPWVEIQYIKSSITIIRLGANWTGSGSSVSWYTTNIFQKGKTYPCSTSPSSICENRLRRCMPCGTRRESEPPIFIQSCSSHVLSEWAVL